MDRPTWVCGECLGGGVLHFEAESDTGEPATETEVCPMCGGTGLVPTSDSTLDEPESNTDSVAHD